MKIMIAAVSKKIRISLNDPPGTFLDSYLETTFINASILEKEAAKNDEQTLGIAVNRCEISTEKIEIKTPQPGRFASIRAANKGLYSSYKKAYHSRE